MRYCREVCRDWNSVRTEYADMMNDDGTTVNEDEQYREDDRRKIRREEWHSVERR